MKPWRVLLWILLVTVTLGIDGGGGSGGAPTVSCPDVGGNHLNYATGTWTCGTSSSGGAPGNAKADGTTKGIATFPAADFVDNGSGLISLQTTLGGHTFSNTNVYVLRDDRLTLQDDADTSKQAQFQLSGLSSAQTRVYALPDVSGTLATRAGTETLTNKTISGASNTLTNITEASLAFTDVTTANASTTQHGLLPKLSGDSATCLKGDGTYGACGTGGSGGATAFSSLTSGTNTSAAMLVGSGASLAPSGGTITASNLTGGLDSSNILTNSNTAKVTGKQIVPRVDSAPLSAANANFNCNTTDIRVVEGISASFTVTLPACTGTNPEPEQEIEYRFKSTGPQTIVWDAAFCALDNIPIATITTGDGVNSDRFKFKRNAVAACWSLVATTVGAMRGITTLSSNATYTCNADIAESCEMQYTGGTPVTISLAAPTGSNVNGRKILTRIMCNSAQNISFSASIVGSANVSTSGQACPNSSTAWTQFGLIYSTTLAKWQLYASTNN